MPTHPLAGCTPAAPLVEKLLATGLAALIDALSSRRRRRTCSLCRCRCQDRRASAAASDSRTTTVESDGDPTGHL